MNTNGFLAPALGVYLWRVASLKTWGVLSPRPPGQRHERNRWSAPAADAYYTALDNMQWQEPPLTREQVDAVLVTFVRDDATGYANQDRVTAVRRIFGELVPGARTLSMVPEQHWPAIVRQVRELQS